MITKHIEVLRSLSELPLTGRTKEMMLLIINKLKMELENPIKTKKVHDNWES